MKEGTFSFQEVRQQSEVVWRDNYCGTTLRFGLLFVVVALGLTLWGIRVFPPQVPLYYSRPWGELQLASPWALFYFPGLGVVFLLLNGLLAGIVFGKHKLLARMLLTAAALVAFLFTFALVRIYWLMV